MCCIVMIVALSGTLALNYTNFNHGSLIYLFSSDNYLFEQVELRNPTFHAFQHSPNSIVVQLHSPSSVNVQHLKPQ